MIRTLACALSPPLMSGMHALAGPAACGAAGAAPQAPFGIGKPGRRRQAFMAESA